MRDISTSFNRLLMIMALIALTGCDGPADTSDPEQMAREQPPEHDPEATYQGRTALQHAERLDDLNVIQQMDALEALGSMGVDALPARESVRAVLADIDSRDLDPGFTEDLELKAVAVLGVMQAPEAGALVRQRIADPDFSDRPRQYARLIELADYIGIEAKVLSDDILPLVDSEPKHAGILLRTGALPESVTESVGQAILASDHDDAMARHFLEHLAGFDFIGDAEALDYIRAHMALAREDIRAIHSTLVAIGSEAALDLAMTISESDFADDPRLVSRFAQAKMGPERAMERMLELIMKAGDRKTIDSLIDGVGFISRNLVRAADDEEAESLSVEDAHQLHISTLTKIIQQGASADHRVAGAERLLRYLQVNRDLALDPALDPVFEVAGSPKQTFETRMAVQRFMGRAFSTLASRDPDYLLGGVVELLWAGDDPETTELPLAMLANARRSPEQAELVIEHINNSLDAHLDQWSVNPAAAVVLNVAGIAQLDRRSAREQGSIAIGQLIASPSAELEYLQPHLMRNMNSIADFGNNTVDGMVGLIGPTIFAEHEAMHRRFEAEAFASILQAQPGWFRDEPESVDAWKLFLTKVAAADRRHFSASAQSALEML